MQRRSLGWQKANSVEKMLLKENMKLTLVQARTMSESELRRSCNNHRQLSWSSHIIFDHSIQNKGNLKIGRFEWEMNAQERNHRCTYYE
jgi:hypothetical protein